MNNKYKLLDYLLLSWQDDDLPVFGRIEYIAIICGYAMFGVFLYHTLGIENHYHSYVIKNTGLKAAYWLIELPDFHTYQAHLLSNGSLYVTLQSHIEKSM